ncbi:ABC transporter transmembrane domain-containing protein, partial [Megamonas funiformis]
MVQILSNMIRPVVWSLLLAILVGTISTLSSISLMGLSAWLIASAALQPPLYVLSLAIVGVRFCGVMRAVFRYLERYFTHKVGFSLFTSFRVFVLTKIIKALPFKQQTENGDAFDLIVNAVDNLRDSFLRFFLPPIITTISVFILSIWFFIYSYDLMILLISSWLIFMIAIPYMTWRRYLKLKKHKFLLTQEIIEFYEGNRELSFYNYDKYRLKNINHSIEQYQQYQQNLFKLKLKVNLCSEFIMGAYLVICLAISIYLVNTQ